VIVGAGPIGCYLAQLLKKAGLNPLLIEEHKELGRPIHCAGVVGRKVFDEAKIPISSDCILNSINGGIVYVGKDKAKFKREGVAYVIDREKFDKKLGEGLNINFATKFLGLEKENGCYTIVTDKGDLTADIVIGADGAKSSVREFVTLTNISYLTGVQFRMEANLEVKDMVQVFVKRPYFYWIIPEQHEIVRVGVISENPYHDLLDFIKERKLNGKILEKFAGKVPLTHFNPLVKEHVFLVGDSASQIKPLTYGGLYMGMRSAEILADCIVKEKFLQYTPLWAEKFGKEIRMALKARQIYSRLSDEDIEKIFAFGKKNIGIIEKKADFENHSLLVWEFLRHPGVSRELLSIFLRIIKANI